MKKILIIFLITITIGLQQAYCENYENNPEACTFVINNVNDEEEKELAYYFRGKYYYDNENYSKAIYDLSESIKRAKSEDSLEESYYYRASSYFYSGEYENAIKDFTESIKRSGNQPESQAESYTYRAMAYMMLGNYKAAIDDATKVIQKGYASTQDWAITTYYTRGLSYQNIENYSAAIADYTSYIQKANQIRKYYYDPKTELLLGNCYYLRVDAKLKTMPLYRSKLDGKMVRYANMHNEMLGLFSELETAIKIYSNLDVPQAKEKKALATELLSNLKATYYK